MVLMVATPELVVALAARDWLWARAPVREMRGLGFDDPRWSTSHAFFANMGGFVLYFKIPDQEEGDAGTSREGDQSEEKPGPLGQNVIQQEGLVRHSLCAARLAMLIREPYELQLPHSTKEELRDRSKSNTLAKLLACMQAGWLVVQCFARVNQHLATSQLEVATAGFVGCTVMTYLFWLGKPRNVESTVAIQCPHELQCQVLELLDGLAIRDSQEAVGDSVQNMGRMPLLTFMNPEGRTTTRMSDIIALVFAAAGLCLCIYVTVQFRIRIDGQLIGGGKTQRGHVWTGASAFILLVPIVIYPMARLLLIAQIFLCFRSMSNTVYDIVDWTRYLSVFN